MDRRRTLATVGAISLTASAAVVALGSSMGLFGLADTSSRVGKLSPIDVSRPARTTTKTIIVTDPAPAASDSNAPGSGATESEATHPRADDHRDVPTRSGTTTPSGGSGSAGTVSPGSPASPTVAPTHHDDDTGHGTATPGADHDDD